MELPVTVGVDTSAASLAAAEWAAAEAALRGRPLRVLHALPLMPHLLPSWAATRPEPAALLHGVGHVLAQRHPFLPTRTEEVRDLATAALVAAAEDAELLVLAARGDGGFPGLRVGSTALRVAARAGCPTVLLPAAPLGRQHREEVVVGVDARSPAEAALEFAFAAAARYGLPLRALQAGRCPGGPADEAELLAQVLAPWQRTHPEVELWATTEYGGGGQVLVAASEKSRLLVLGRRSTGSGLGSVAHAVLHHADCPVALVPQS
ncbi:universal stress protein [Kitasatospora sp. NPDC002227]|uniref:universal stress protein n=1 Tax=Kitasatospora sp. NPDC002227 TaxID=3154773 RepID=UPI0033275418